MVDFYHVLTLKCPIGRTVQTKPNWPSRLTGQKPQQPDTDAIFNNKIGIQPAKNVISLGWYQKIDPKSAPFVCFQPRGSSFWQPKMDGLKHKKMTRPPIVSYRVDIYVYRKKTNKLFLMIFPSLAPTHLGVSPTWNSDYVRFFWGPSMLGETQLGL